MHYMANMFTFVHVHNVANGLTYGPKSASNLTDEIQTLLLPLADNKEGFIHSFSVHLARQITSDRPVQGRGDQIQDLCQLCS